MEIQLDEIQWRLPQAVEFYRGVHTDSVHLYFMNSPFFDPTSNNGVLRQQSELNPAMQYLLRSRADFENRLKTMQGLEFMVVQEPQQLSDGQDTGIWIIRKQERQKRPGKEDELTVLGSYFVVGEDVYQAPSIGDIIRNRLLSVTTSLTSLLSLTSSLPLFNSAEGYSYLPPTSKDLQLSTIATSRSPSRANTPGSDTFQQPGHEPSSDEKSDLSLLWDSFQLASRYGSEFADENPLLGEPGSFVFSSTSEHLQTQASKVTSSQKSATNVTSSFASGVSTPTSVSRKPTPVPISAGPESRQGVLPPVRKGSKAPGTGSTPTTPISAGGTGKISFKRRKSKPPGTEEIG
ncbi:MED6-domain-containing protein [Eremomyces bilateralis CBS 781.70]|uniref:Mediator of RNA polymerase II transcription subunit 6 n=1 Tax=Eremomyces bilateralis CBS 781.70 TaxID=1392243 RepID=A0A6G1G973_9PEZI|nr:MED6-domain-containing protein [Eremomyces bilateralis CBS 781.70]KAF1814627.1 MED6-domain-containing protein [Eremomyces bilateralis CBS 781.70]